MFFEMSTYRKQFIARQIWTPEMESFWLKILPKQFVISKKDYLKDQLKRAEADFDSDSPVKVSS